MAAGPGWQWIFAVNLPLCLIAVALGLGMVPTKVNDQGRSTAFDWAGAVLVGLGGTAIVILGSSGTAARNPTLAAGLVLVAVLMAAGLVRTDDAPQIP